MPYKNSYFIIDQIYYHIPSKRNVLLNIYLKNPTAAQKEKFKEQILFYNNKNKRDGDENAVGMFFIITEKKISVEYVIPYNFGKSAEDFGLPSPDIFDSFLQKSLADLRMI